MRLYTYMQCFTAVKTTGNEFDFLCYPMILLLLSATQYYRSCELNISLHFVGKLMVVTSMFLKHQSEQNTKRWWENSLLEYCSVRRWRQNQTSVFGVKMLPSPNYPVEVKWCSLEKTGRYPAMSLAFLEVCLMNFFFMERWTFRAAM